MTPEERATNMADGDHVPQFESGSWFEISGRGWCCAVRNPGGYPEPNVLTGRSVLIDGESFGVRGVESFAISRPYPDTLDFALLVDHEPAQIGGPTDG